jgi:hypothetical protein
MQRLVSDSRSEREESHAELTSLRRHHTVVEVELERIQEMLHGVLDLSQAQQLQLDSSIWSLSQRCTAALTTLSPSSISPADASNLGSHFSSNQPVGTMRALCTICILLHWSDPNQPEGGVKVMKEP